MKTAKIKEWKDLNFDQKRGAFEEMRQNICGLGNRLRDLKSGYANYLKPWLFDECGNRVYLFNSIIEKGESNV